MSSSAADLIQSKKALMQAIEERFMSRLEVAIGAVELERNLASFDYQQAVHLQTTFLNSREGMYLLQREVAELELNYELIELANGANIADEIHIIKQTMPVNSVRLVICKDEAANIYAMTLFSKIQENGISANPFGDPANVTSRFNTVSTACIEVNLRVIKRTVEEALSKGVSDLSHARYFVAIEDDSLPQLARLIEENRMDEFEKLKSELENMYNVHDLRIAFDGNKLSAQDKYKNYTSKAVKTRREVTATISVTTQSFDHVTLVADGVPILHQFLAQPPQGAAVAARVTAVYDMAGRLIAPGFDVPAAPQPGTSM